MKNNTLPTPPLTQYHANYNFKTKMKPDNLSPQYNLSDSHIYDGLNAVLFNLL